MTLRNTLTVLVIDDHAGVRNALVRLIDGQRPKLCTVGAAATGGEAMALACQLRPNVILLDVVLGSEDGLALIVPLQRTSHGAVVVLTSLVDPRVAARAYQLGAVACIHKSAPATDLLFSIAAAPSRSAHLPP